MQTYLELEAVVGEMAPAFLSAWEGFPRNKGSGCQSLALIYALFLLDGGRRREGEKKGKMRNHCGRGGFLRLDLPCWLCHASQLLVAIKG
jgi:hypothetical protein